MERSKSKQDYPEDTVLTAYAGNLSCEAIHLATASSITTDAPLDNQGLGRTFSPTDLVATALCTCMLTIMGIRSAKEGWELGKTRLACKKIMASGPRRISGLALTIDWDKGLTMDQRKLLKSIAEQCPVAHSISSGIEVTWSE